MPRARQKTVYLLILLTLAATLLAYFGRPKPPLLELATPRQELPSYTEHYPGDTSLSDRVSKSYGLAMVLVQSPYTQKNVVALESLRSWARARFQQQPDFLHPVSLPASDDTNQTFIDAFCSNLFTGMHYWLQDQVGHLVSARIAAFHETKAYLSFRNAYYDLFALNADAATLLARYQSDKAKLAIDVILLSGLWLIAILSGILSVIKTRPVLRYETAQQVLSRLWLLAGLCYLVLACTRNDVSLVVSSIVSASIGLYLRAPFVLQPSEQLSDKIRFISLKSNWTAFAIWLSFSLVVMQSFTWIRTGSITAPDPISLLLSSITGNFLQEPLHGKHLVALILGLSWLVASIWALSQAASDARAAQEAEESLATLKDRSRILLSEPLSAGRHGQKSNSQDW